LIPPGGEFTYKGSDKELGASYQNWVLTKGSVRIRGKGSYMELILPSPKTDPFWKGITLTIAASNDATYPIHAIQHFFSHDTHRPPHSPLLCRGRVEQQAFTREYVVQQLQHLALMAGLGQGSWNGHSFRRGTATWAAQVGIPDREIQILSRWRSDAYNAYIEFSNCKRISLSKWFQLTRNPHS